MNLTLETSIQYVPRVGPAMAKRLYKLGIRTVRNLLFYPPFRYNDFSHTVPINRIVAGSTVTVSGEVQSIKNIFTKTGKKIQEAVIGDTTGLLTVVWFNQIYLPKVIHQQDRISLSGTIGFFGHKLVMESPDYELLKEDEGETLHTGRFVPVYSETSGVSSKWLRGRIAYLLTLTHTFLSEPLPRTILEKNQLMSLSEALHTIHFPSNLTEAEQARKRLAFDELLFLQLASRIKKRQWEQDNQSPNMTIQEKDIQEFIQQLPFILTDGQQKAIRHICGDLVRSVPMNRLLEGDVGSGKTVVAALAMYLVYKNGYTSVMMAPTQILAEQHYMTIQKLMEPFGIPVKLVIGGHKQKTEGRRQKTEDRRQKTENTNPSSVIRHPSSIFIGTHALLQESVTMQNVGLVIVDEQQRFGVAQRAVIKKKGSLTLTPHFLTMTATPIPRTLALTLYGNLDLSILNELPKGRTPIRTWVVPKEKRMNAYEWIKKQLQQTDCRAFLVCPFIEESESMKTIKAVKKEFDYLSKDIFPDIPLGLLHGKLKPKEKNETLDNFRQGKTKILVTTPVVEVGIDIKEASIMVIEGADRFGLSQLHQLRGRVGRGNLTSYCLLFTESSDEKTIERLKILEKVKNGPELAEYDLKLRGEGDIMGMRQHGLPPLTLASLKDVEMVEQSQRAAADLLSSDPTLTNFPLLREQVEKDIIGDGIQD